MVHRQIGGSTNRTQRGVYCPYYGKQTPHAVTNLWPVLLCIGLLTFAGCCCGTVETTDEAPEISVDSTDTKDRSNRQRTSRATPDRATPPIASVEPIPYRVIKSDIQTPYKCSYDIEVDFVDGVLPTEEQLAAISEELKSRSPKVDRIFVVFYVPGETVDVGGWATAHHNPDLTVNIIRQPEPPGEQRQEKFGLSLDLRKRLYLENLKIEDAELPGGKEQEAKQDLFARYGITEDEFFAIVAEANRNQWPLPQGAELDAAIAALPPPPMVTASSASEPPSRVIPKFRQRVFADASGRFNVEATLVSYEDGIVTLRKTDGSEVSLPIEKLSDFDRRYVEKVTSDQ